MADTETFWAQIGAYNQATAPIQAVLLVVGLALTYRLFTRPGAATDAMMKAFLACAFAWNGLVYFLFFTRSPISTFVGAPLFLVIAALFVVDIGTKRTGFGPPQATWQRGLTFLWLLLALLYPAIGWALGHPYPGTCTPTMPCPLTVFAIALLAAAVPGVDRKVYGALLVWALLGLPKCLGVYGCYEDCILFAAGVYGLVVLVTNRQIRPSRPRAT
jgi:hypothetical protein